LDVVLRTLAVLRSEPVVLGAVTAMVTVLLEPLASDPTLHVTFPLALVQVPPVNVPETNVAPDGSVSVNTTFVAFTGPLLVTGIV
jgi:hypothetical protein